jgi:carboxymethylenebutenolidase
MNTMKHSYGVAVLVTTVIATSFLGVNNITQTFAQQGGQNRYSTAGVFASDSDFKAIGTIANVQYEDGSPSWVLSGLWKLGVHLPSSEDSSSTAKTNFVASFMMVRTDGTAMHSHRIYDFEMLNWSIDGETKTFSGTGTVTLRDGPKTDVPMSITIKNNGIMMIDIDSSVVDHFGSDPIYGPVMRVFDNTAGKVMQGSTGMEPDGLARNSVSYHPSATGYLVYPENASGQLPAVVMIHEWWGLNQNIKNMAEVLAKEGYVVLAVDLYGGQVATESGQASSLAASVRNNPGPAIDNLRAAVKYLSSLDNVDSSRIASLGWCFGGGWSLQLALNAENPMAATVIYYGSLVTDEDELSKIGWPVLGIFGSTDQSIPVETVRQFESALNANSITNEIYIYEGVGHAFANPSGDNYAPEETKDAWQKTLAFLDKHLGQ